MEVIVEVIVKELETMLVKKIKRIRKKAEEVVKVVEEIKRVKVRVLRGDN